MSSSPAGSCTLFRAVCAQWIGSAPQEDPRPEQRQMKFQMPPLVIISCPSSVSGRTSYLRVVQISIAIRLGKRERAHRSCSRGGLPWGHASPGLAPGREKGIGMVLHLEREKDS